MMESCSGCRLQKMLYQSGEMQKCPVIKAAEATFRPSRPGVGSKSPAGRGWLEGALCEASAGSERLQRRNSYLQMASRWWDHDYLLFSPPGSSWYDSHRDLPDYYLRSFLLNPHGNSRVTHLSWFYCFHCYGSR